MKKLCLFFIMLTLLSTIAFAQEKIEFGLNGGLLTTTGAMMDQYDQGMEYSLYYLLDVGMKPFKFAVGASAAFFTEGKTEKISMFDAEWDTLSAVNVNYSKTDYTSYFMGLHVEEKWLYFRPLATLNYHKGNERGGLDVEGGLMIPVFDSFKLNLVSAKYRILNLIGRDENERYATFFQIGGGFLFSF